MKRNIMQALNSVPDGKQPQHGFDLSNFATFTQKGGMLNVVGVRDTVPNSDYFMSVDAFTRSLPCNTANFAHIKENYYFIHVPLGLVNRNAYQMLVQRREEYSALGMGINQFPTFLLRDVLERLCEIAILDVSQDANKAFADVHGFNIAAGAFRLLDMLGYGNFLDVYEALTSGVIPLYVAKSIVQSVGNKRPTANRLAAYQMCWYYFFRNDIYDNEVSARCFNFDDVTWTNQPNVEPDYDILHTRNIDDFIIECCQLRYVGYKKDLFTAFMPGTQFGPVSSIPVNITFSGLSATFVGDAVTPQLVKQVATVVGDHSHSAVVSDDYEHHNLVKVVDGNLVNLSDAEKTTIYGTNDEYLKQSDTVAGSVRVDSAPHLADSTHQVNLLITPGNTNPAVYDIHSHSADIGVVSSGNFYNVLYEQTSIAAITPTGTVSLSGDAPSTSSLFDVLQLVEAEAIQKWRQKSMLAGNHTADQFRAHHGEVPRHLIDHLPDFIGSVDNEIQITEITSQADTAVNSDESNLGEIAGRGYGASDNKRFHFHSSDYGVLLLLHAIVPENTYSSYGIDAGNTMVYYNDFYQSEFTNLGLRAVPKYLLNVTDNTTPDGNAVGTGTDTFTTDVGILGYAPADFQYKTYPSKVHGLFNPGRLMLGSAETPWSPDVFSRFGFDDMQSFVITRPDLASRIYVTSQELVIPSTITLSLTHLYVNPSIFDSIFSVMADDSQTTDEFITHAKFVCDSSLPMPVLGLPQF